MAKWIHVHRFCDVTVTPHCKLVLGPQYTCCLKACSVGGCAVAGLSVVVANRKWSSFSELTVLLFLPCMRRTNRRAVSKSVVTSWSDSQYHTSEIFFTCTNLCDVSAQPVRIFYLFLPALLISVNVLSVSPLLQFGMNYLPLSGSQTHWTPLNADLTSLNHPQRITTSACPATARASEISDFCARYKFFIIIPVSAEHCHQQHAFEQHVYCGPNTNLQCGVRVTS